MEVKDKKKELLQRLAEIRKHKKLSYSDMAQRSLISANLVEQIEKGRVRPSTGALKQIAQALEIHLADLFEEVGISEERIKDFQPGMEVVLIKREMRQGLPVKGSKAFYQNLTPRGMERNLELLWHEVEAGASGGDWLSHDGEECCLVIKGRFRIYISDDVYDLEEGDSLWFKTHHRHRWENPYKEPATVLWAITPPWF